MLDYLQMTGPSSSAIVDLHRNPEMWIQDGGRVAAPVSASNEEADAG